MAPYGAKKVIVWRRKNSEEKQPMKIGKRVNVFARMKSLKFYLIRNTNMHERTITDSIRFYNVRVQQ